MSGISWNAHGNNIPNRDYYVNHLKALQPPAVLTLDNLDLARRIKSEIPSTTSIFREFGSKGDGDLHTWWNPEDWLNKHAHQSEGGIVLHVLNEPPFNDEVAKWLLELLKLAAPRKIPLAVGNWAVGNPKPEQWPIMRELLLFMDKHRDLFILGLHEYAGGIITSGLYGGYPNNAGVHPGQPGGKNLIPVDNWPKSMVDPDTGNPITRYHMGRFQFLLDYCDEIHLRYPRIILTEHGFDDTSDIKAWEDTLRKNPGYLNIRGWKTLQNQWKDWFSGLGWSPQRAYFEQLVWADRVIYQNSPVEAQCIFCWGHSSQEWDQFDMAGENEFHKLLETYARTVPPKQPEQTPPVILTLFPDIGDPNWEERQLTASNIETNIRRQPTTHSPVLRVFISATAKIIPHTLLKSDQQFFDQLGKGGFGFWVPIIMGDVKGWIRSDVVVEGVLKSNKSAPEQPAPEQEQPEAPSIDLPLLVIELRQLNVNISRLAIAVEKLVAIEEVFLPKAM
jgi:hypothetical protein